MGHYERDADSIHESRKKTLLDTALDKGARGHGKLQLYPHLRTA